MPFVFCFFHFDPLATPGVEAARRRFHEILRRYSRPFPHNETLLRNPSNRRGGHTSRPALSECELPDRRRRHSPGSREVLLPPRPLRTARDSFPSCSSSLHERPSRDAAALVRSSCTWICRWQLTWNNSKLSAVSRPPRLRQMR